ncbi:RloB family protein [Hymenobacter nivis]|uniref:RloB domain-containing protein n=1 Tax=Hymenobacter nivis TaxID=1850093 RepID=A0A502GPL9_9BACT|nr:RloB family protein [Hymenobacter nivis]TPG62863.1 RloB domain-containing protein [Hymenobacter nivis]
MGREQRPFDRISEVRDAKLFVLAAEGERTEVDYFKYFKESLNVNPSRIHIKILEREPDKKGNGSPKEVIAQLDDYKLKNDLNADDELWLLIDRDKQTWSSSEISQVARSCKQKKYGFALSNPCFELWLLLHFKDLSNASIEEKKLMLENKKVTSKKTYLKHQVGLAIKGAGYNPSNLNGAEFIKYIPDAIARAKALDKNEKTRWTLDLGTRVYILIENIFQIIPIALVNSLRDVPEA